MHVPPSRPGPLALAALVVLASAVISARPFPDIIPLPADFGPEGPPAPDFVVRLEK